LCNRVDPSLSASVDPAFLFGSKLHRLVKMNPNNLQANSIDPDQMSHKLPSINELPIFFRTCVKTSLNTMIVSIVLLMKKSKLGMTFDISLLARTNWAGHIGLWW
jgi:hypothetical protein